MPIDTPHWPYPFQLRPTGAREVEQLSMDELEASIQHILRFPLGFREELPGFGVRDLLFREVTSDLIEEIRTALERWDDRTEALIEENPAEFEEMIRRITITIKGASDA